MHCDPTLQRGRGGRSVGEGSFQAKEGASSSGQLDSFIAPGKEVSLNLPHWGHGAEAEAGKGISPVLPSGRESHLAQINGERNSKPPLPESEVVRYPVPANRPKGLTVSPSPNPHPSAAPNRKLGVGGASRPLVHHVHEAGAKVNIHRAPLTQQPTVPPAERKRKWVRTVTSGITLRSRNGGAWLPC